jgi:hypothetical protein
MLHHEVVPNYLRTKLDLDLEAKQEGLVQEAKRREAALKDEITAYNNIIKSCQKIVSDARDDIEDQKSRTGTFQTTTSADTRKLVAAYLHGTGLTPLTNQRKDQLMGVRVSRHPTGGGGGRVQSAMKTDVKEAAAPYSVPRQRRT